MSRHNLISAQNNEEDMVSPLTSNVCITCPAALNTIACMCQIFVMSLPGMSLGDWFSVNRKGGTVADWLVYICKGWNSMAVSRFGCKNPSV